MWMGRSVRGRAIRAYVRSGPVRRSVLVLAGMHGDEPKSVFVARRLKEWLAADAQAGRAARWIIVPTVNPDGLRRHTRRNARGVDINRNFPTRNWEIGSRRSRMYGGPRPGSEPETRAIIRAVAKFRPWRIVTIHSIGKHRFCNNYDGPGRAVAHAMSRCNGYPVTASIGYPTPGSFGAWSGQERGIPTITLELPSQVSAKRCWDDNREAILAAADDPLTRPRGRAIGAVGAGNPPGRGGHRR
jgi:protein MpaA